MHRKLSIGFGVTVAAFAKFEFPRNLSGLFNLYTVYYTYEVYTLLIGISSAICVAYWNMRGTVVPRAIKWMYTNSLSIMICDLYSVGFFSSFLLIFEKGWNGLSYEDTNTYFKSRNSIFCIPTWAFSLGNINFFPSDTFARKGQTNQNEKNDAYRKSLARHVLDTQHRKRIGYSSCCWEHTARVNIYRTVMCSSESLKFSVRTS